MVCCLADLLCRYSVVVLFLDACFVVVVVGSDDVLRAGSFFLPVALKKIGFYGMRQSSPMHCLVDPRLQ